MAKELTGEIGSVKYGRDGRSKTTELATDEPNVVLAVYTSHRKGGVYSSSAMGVRNLPDEGIFTVSRSSPMDYVSLGSTEQGSRFSAKNLDAAHTDALFSVAATSLDTPDAFAKVLAAVPGVSD